MEGATLPPEMSAWRRHTHPDGYGYGWLLVLILVSLAFQMAAPDAEGARLVTIGLQGTALVAALAVSRAHRWLLRTAALAAAVAVIGATGVLIGPGELDAQSGQLLSLLLVVLAPVAIATGIVRQARAARAVTIRTMFGVLCVYLLIGMAFAFAYALIGAAENDRFFAEIRGGTHADFLYFSFATITTTGFGDLTAARDLGRSLAITEALIGQIYLVTVVALIVGNLSPRGRPPSTGDAVG